MQCVWTWCPWPHASLSIRQGRLADPLC
jgi:hypothetical protein